MFQVSTTQNERTKFSPRARSCVFLGYLAGFKGYKLLDLEIHFVQLDLDFLHTIDRHLILIFEN